jgi:predicted adenine nucleotide alpha hydrolase (AANH) superfamily ATPase
MDKNSLKKERLKLMVPGGESKILLHSCCAPCAGDVMAEMKRSGIDYTILFYNPNIHPIKEYEIRKNENKRFADKLGVPFVDLDYDKKAWFHKVKGYEHEPERGYRCTLCFDMRFERSALYASENGFKIFSSTLGTSRWKNLEQINGCGVRAAERYKAMTYWTFDWRKKGGANRMVEISKDEQFYQQEYCGCAYSLRDTNQSRLKRGKAPIKLGLKFYSHES